MVGQIDPRGDCLAMPHRHILVSFRTIVLLVRLLPVSCFADSLCASLSLARAVNFLGSSLTRPRTWERLTSLASVCLFSFHLLRQRPAQFELPPYLSSPRQSPCRTRPNRGPSISHSLSLRASSASFPAGDFWARASERGRSGVIGSRRPSELATFKVIVTYLLQGTVGGLSTLSRRR